MSQVSIVCNFDLGIRKQEIYVCNTLDDTVTPIGEYGIEDLPLVLAGQYYNFVKINPDTEVHLYGPDELIINLARQILTIGQDEYGLAGGVKIELN